jgi:hypothetical protein
MELVGEGLVSELQMLAGVHLDFWESAERQDVVTVVVVGMADEHPGRVDRTAEDFDLAASVTERYHQGLVRLMMPLHREAEEAMAYHLVVASAHWNLEQRRVEVVLEEASHFVEGKACCFAN